MVFVSAGEGRRLSRSVDVLRSASALELDAARAQVRNGLMVEVGRSLVLFEPAMVVLLDQVERPVGRNHLRIEQACELTVLKRSLV